MRIILLGPPGSGKGTQAQFIMQKYKIPQIATGNLLRQAINDNTKLGNDVKYFINKGKLVPDQIVISLIIDYIIKNDYKKNFILDGFPRNINQANAMHKSGIIIDYIIQLIVPDNIIIERITGRRIHQTSGRSYHISFNPPKKKGVDDLTGETLIIRKDDQLDIIKQRLSLYHKEINFIVNFYKEKIFNNIKIYQINGILPLKEITKKIFELIDNN